MKTLLALLAAALLLPATATATITATPGGPTAVPYNAAAVTTFTTTVAQTIQINDLPYWVTSKACPNTLVKRGTWRRLCTLAAGESVMYSGPVRYDPTFTYAQNAGTGDFASVTYTLTTAQPDVTYTFWRQGCRPWTPGSCV